jgi:endonuclease YncB( thermonuclease family)
MAGAQGLLEVDATLDLGQFWPDGESDADTTKVVVRPLAFRFRQHAGAPFKVTHVFDGAKVRGKSGTKPVLDAKGRMTVRLEGIDAPELHYTPQAVLKKAERTAQQHALYLRWNLKYRQHLAETATTALADLLGGGGVNPMPCRVTTAVDKPNDVCDTYARFVGYLKVDVGGQEVVVNDWLTRLGWTFPAFYSSMLEHEIVSLRAAGRQGRQAGGVWAELTASTRPFDFRLVYRGKGAAPDPAGDVGPVLFPKLFRRRSEHAVNRRAKMITAGFRTFLRTKQSDFCFDTDEFLDQGPSASTPVHLADLIDGHGDFTRDPDEVVFQEAPSTLVTPGGKTNW